MSDQRKEFTVQDGERRVIRDTYPDAASALRGLVSMVDEVPEGWTLWYARIRRSDRGLRCDVELVLSTVEAARSSANRPQRPT